MWTSALFGAKIILFFEIFGVSARTRGGEKRLEPVWTEGKGVSFSRFCPDVVYGRPLNSLFTQLRRELMAKFWIFKTTVRENLFGVVQIDSTDSERDVHFGRRELLKCKA